MPEYFKPKRFSENKEEIQEAKKEKPIIEQEDPEKKIYKLCDEILKILEDIEEDKRDFYVISLAEYIMLSAIQNTDYLLIKMETFKDYLKKKYFEGEINNREWME